MAHHEVKQQARVLLLSNLYPTNLSPTSGVFISERVRAHRNIGTEVTTYAISPHFSGIVRGLRRLTRRGSDALAVGSDFKRPQAFIGTREYFQTKQSGLQVSTLRKIASAITSELSTEYDIVHAHGMYLYAAGAIAQVVAEQLSLPFLVTLHGSDVNHYLAGREQQFQTVLGAAAGVLTVSTALRTNLEKADVKAKSWHTVPNGVDIDLFHERSQSDPSRPRIAYVGNLIRVKGADRLPALFSRIHAAWPQAAFDVVGDGPLRQDLTRQMAHLPVSLHGRLERTEVAEVLRNAAALVMPSRSEGWPTVIFEAHASGTPVVGTDVGGISEAVGDRRYVVADGADVSGALAERVVELLHDPPNMDTLASRARRHTWNNIAQMESRIYDKIIRSST